MRVLRNLGPLTSRPHVSWLSRLIQRFSRPDVPFGYNGQEYAGLIMKPALFGKVLHTPVDTLPLDKFTQLQRLLRQNVDLSELASEFRSEITDYGLLSTKLVTNAGVAFLAGAFASAVNISDFKDPGFGVGTAAESASDTGLNSELTTQYATNSTRVTGSQANSANIYTTVATLSPDSGGTIAITEHGIFAGATGANTMWDRSVFSPINLESGSDSLQVSYNLTLVSGS